jgi:hypothetical protein
MNIYRVQYANPQTQYGDSGASILFLRVFSNSVKASFLSGNRRWQVLPKQIRGTIQGWWSYPRPICFILLNLLELPDVYARHPLLMTVHCYLNCTALTTPATEKSSLHVNLSKFQNCHQLLVHITRRNLKIGRGMLSNEHPNILT